MKRYKVLRSKSPSGLSKMVTEYLNNGWELHGSMSAVYDGSRSELKAYYLQPLITEDDVEFIPADDD